MIHFLSRAFVRSSAVLLLGTCAVALAQEDAARIGTQEDVLRRRQPEADRPSVEINAGDPDLGEVSLVSRTPRPKMFTFSTSQNFFYTSNAFLVPEDERGSLVWNGRLSGSYVPYATRNFTPRLTFEQNFFRYARFSELDFNSQSLQLDLKYDFNREDTWYANLSYAIARLEAPHSDVDEFYRFGLLNASVTHLRQLGGTPIYFSGTLGSTFRHGDPSAFDRVTAYLAAALSYSPLEHLQLSLFARPEVQFYTNDPLDSSRTDFNLNVGASAILSPLEYVSLGVSVGFVGNYSSLDARDYELFSPSAVVSAQIAF